MWGPTEGKSPRARSIAFYLPQFHPVPENDQWWGQGFTEWTNVTRARPLFRGHLQPRLPGGLGFYDLRVPEVREQQARLARDAGIEGFCYWHYWFGNGKRVLERVFGEVVESGKPDFPFCLGWANESWTGRWHGLDSSIILEQNYPGKADYLDHFRSLRGAFADRRYIEVDGRKLFAIYRPELIPDLDGFLDFWNELATNEGWKGFFFVSANVFFDHHTHPGIEGVIPGRDLFRVMAGLGLGRTRKMIERLVRRSGRQPARLLEQLGSRPMRRKYSDFARVWSERKLGKEMFGCVVPNWDNTPRSGRRGVVLVGSTPELFAEMVDAELKKIADRPFDRRLLFIKSWNEWAEGNYLEPDQEWGMGYLEALRKSLLGE